MTKANLVEAVARATELSKKQAETIVDTVLDKLTGALQRAEGVELRGFGSFGIRERAPREGRNPKTGRSVQVPAKRVSRAASLGAPSTSGWGRAATRSGWPRRAGT